MNTSSQWRYDIAQKLGQLYASNPHVAAVILGGSTARGHADRYSDIEIGVFWRQPPLLEERQQVVQKAQGDLIYLYDYDPDEPVWCDDFMLGRDAADQPRTGLLIEVSHYTTDFVAQILNDVLKEHSTRELSHNLMSGILDAIPFHGADLVHSWQKDASQYPKELAAAMVQMHGVIDHFWRWEMYLERSENLFPIYESFARIHRQILHMLLGLNRVYYFGFKWIDVVDSRLSIKPADLLVRLRQPYTSSPAEGAEQVIQLVEDTFSLVETHLPEVNVERLREIFRYRRPLWEDSPPK